MREPPEIFRRVMAAYDAEVSPIVPKSLTEALTYIE
jgi:hypothetical protein